MEIIFSALPNTALCTFIKHTVFNIVYLFVYGIIKGQAILTFCAWFKGDHNISYRRCSMYVCMCMCFLFVCAVMENPHVVTFFFMNLGFVYCSVYDLNTLLFRV